MQDLNKKTLEQLYTTLDAICLNKKLHCSIRFVTTTHSGVLAKGVKAGPYYILEIHGYKRLPDIKAETRVELLSKAIPIIKTEIAKGGI